MKAALAITLCLSLPALAGGRDGFIWGAGAFNTNYRPPGYVPAHTPDWRALQPSWRGGFVSYPNARHGVPVAPVVPYTYYPSYYAYGSPYYGFQSTEPEPPAPEPARTPPQVIVFEHARPEPAEPEPAPQPQIIVVQVPVPAPVAPAPAPAAAAVAVPAPAPQPKTPPRDVFHWVDADGVHNYSTNPPPGVKAEKVGPK